MSNTTPSATIRSDKIKVDTLVCSTLWENTFNAITLQTTGELTIDTISALEGDPKTLSWEENTKLTENTTHTEEIETNSVIIQDGSSSISINSSINIYATTFTVNSLETSLNAIKISKSEDNGNRIDLNSPDYIALTMTDNGNGWSSTYDLSLDYPKIECSKVGDLTIVASESDTIKQVFTIKEYNGTEEATIDYKTLDRWDLENTGTVTYYQGTPPTINNITNFANWVPIDQTDLDTVKNYFVHFTYNNKNYIVYYVPDVLYDVDDGYIDLVNNTVYKKVDADLTPDSYSYDIGGEVKWVTL